VIEYHPESVSVNHWCSASWRGLLAGVEGNSSLWSYRAQSSSRTDSCRLWENSPAI